jgi:hypothetical protein
MVTLATWDIDQSDLQSYRSGHGAARKSIYLFDRYYSISGKCFPLHKLFGEGMRPTRIQYFFARDWPGKLWFVVVPTLVAMFYHSAAPTSLSWLNWVLGVLGGFLVALLVGWPVLGAASYDRLRKNGGPFKVGDMVQILVGPHRGRVTRVYSLWQGDAVRVELGEKEKASYSDVFGGTKLLKERGAEPNAASGLFRLMSH